ncbi:MAG: hypothetical protein HOP37_12565 [Cyclobacteriaceae bacterium]|nr:hypothetical protein [Cyclobacteriaceae bacterium]
MGNKYQNLGSLILNVSAQYKRALISLMVPYQLSVPQLEVLRLLDRASGSVSIEFIKANLAQGTLDVSRMVEDLHSREFIDKTKSAADRRVYQVNLSINGKSVLRQIEKRSLETKLLGNLQVEEVDKLQCGLMKLLSTIENNFKINNLLNKKQL